MKGPPQESAPKAKPRSIKFQLLVAVNGALAVAVLVFLGYDYRRELGDRLNEKRIALEEEAKTILPAVLHIAPHGRAVVQAYIDTVCGQMQDAESPGHHIAVRLPDGTLQAVAHHRASPEILDAMIAAAGAPQRRAPFRDTELVVGSDQRDGVQVLVSETVGSLRRASRRAIAGRLLELLVLAVLAAVILNVVLWRLVTHPLGKLVATVRAIAAGRLGATTGGHRSAELCYLADEINQMSESLAATDRDRAIQMAKARKIQQHLLPANGETSDFRVAPLFRPADEVAGDYYDVLPLPDGAWLFCVADVTGHGVPAAMSAAVVKTLLLDAIEHVQSPSAILQYINRRYCDLSLSGDFVTVFLACYDPNEQRLRYASAGHEPALVRSPSGKTDRLPATGFPVGLRAEAEWGEQVVTVESGQRLLMVTDGVTEMFDADGRCFGRARMAECFAATDGCRIDQAVQQMSAVLVDFRQNEAPHDDVTLVLIEMVLHGPSREDETAPEAAREGLAPRPVGLAR